MSIEDGRLLGKITLVRCAPTSHYDSTLTVANFNIIKQALNRPLAIENGKNRGQKVPTDTCRNRTAESWKTCNYFSAKGNIQFGENANTSRKVSEPAADVMSYKRDYVDGKRNFCILRNVCTRSPSSRYDKTFFSKIMFKQSSTSKLDKPDNNTDITNTSTQSGYVEFNVVLNNLTNPIGTLGSSSFNSNIELIPQKVHWKVTSSKKLNTLISFRLNFSGFSYPLVET